MLATKWWAKRFCLQSAEFSNYEGAFRRAVTLVPMTGSALTSKDLAILRTFFATEDLRTLPLLARAFNDPGIQHEYGTEKQPSVLRQSPINFSSSVQSPDQTNSARQREA